MKPGYRGKHQSRQSKKEKDPKRQADNGGGGGGREWKTCGNDVFGGMCLALTQCRGLINYGY